MIFRDITLKDMTILDECKRICSDYIFSGLYMYKDSFKLKISENDGVIIICSDMAAPRFYMPLGDIEKGIKAVTGYCKEIGISPAFIKIPEDYLAMFNDFGFRIEEDRDSFDYIYRNTDFLEFKGKHFRNLRNNLYSYLRNYSPSFSEDVKAYREQCKALAAKHSNSANILEPTLKMLDNIDVFNLKGGVVLNGKEVSAFCLYEDMTEDTVVSHVELTDNSHRGLHAYLIREMAKVMGEKYINKEDDMGLPGLRRFKEGQNPCRMLKKYKAFA
ncbi:MAG: hypothetical protein K0R84_1202 [Clostridia bacterium]|nr:hypothetical protein [Clostridia bacterium]